MQQPFQLRQSEIIGRCFAGGGKGVREEMLKFAFSFYVYDEFNLKTSFHSQVHLGSLIWTKFIEMFCKIIMMYFDKPMTCI